MFFMAISLYLLRLGRLKPNLDTKYRVGLAQSKFDEYNRLNRLTPPGRFVKNIGLTTLYLTKWLCWHPQ